MNFTKLVLSKNLSATSRNLLDRAGVPTALSFHKSNKHTSSSSSSSSSDSDDELKKKPSPNDPVNKLNSLLEQMMSNDKARNSLNLAKPPNKREEGRKEKELVISKSVEKQMVNAVQNVAESLGGNTKQTESELLMKLLNPVKNGGESADSLSDILKGMKIEREVKPQESKAEQVRNLLKSVSSRRGTSEMSKSNRRPKRPSIPMSSHTKVDQVTLFVGENLGIFTNPSELKDTPQLSTWKKLHDQELKVAVTHPPTNYFQEMILWTNQGKFWQFPINNEFGLEDESKVYFTDHIFLEEHLEPWCPSRGPIRHFMELVCVGLSKNSYLTVQAKREHIEWFKNYFEEKKQLLLEVGALPVSSDNKPSIKG